MAEAATPSPVINPVSTGYRRYALWVLLIIYTLNFLDRQVVNILAEPIKRDLGLADWQLGMMTGLAFAVFYTVLGIPIARIAETKNRPVIIGASVAAWSAFTVLCGFTQNFWQLILARIGVGVGEAGCTPPAHSLITDYVPREKRASAIAFYSIGTPLGTLAGMAMGGLVADAYGWRAAFMVAGAPGVLFALVAALTLVEPRKKLAAEMAARASSQISFAAALAVLATKKTFWLVALAASIKAFIGYGHAPFTASFFFRNHGPELAQLASTFGLKSAGFLGLALGLIGGTAGVIGAWLGGVFADRLGAKDLRAYVTVPAIASVITIPIYITAVSLDAPMTAIGLLAINALLGTLWYGPVYATAQSIVDPALRATASAVLLLIINLIGLGLGPLAVGILSDVLSGHMGLGEAQGVRWALIASATLGLAAFGLFWAARNSIREEMVA
ncbi:spinster family MFS transporter [Caulobacter segnis]|uniref:spinster family MFS transporter n=1 Tax=Caulobacter segnis TaxID=88688 RepID=UPI001CBED819|nr:MFS transporter [Caulobacter segnis]UAL11917.1 MFS transporter [Caulobacter segnis]